MNEVDRLVRLRIKVLIFAAFAFGLWQLAWIGKDIFTDSDRQLYLIFGSLSALGGLCWCFAGYFFHSYSKQVKQANVGMALNDELTLQNRSKAFIFGYALMLSIVWLLIPVADFWQFKLIFAIRAIVTLGITLPIVYFAYLERQNFEELE
ncbi:MAG: hypothetical protein COB38_05400 [Gammaproteobacteria bacterium]|nr:MAG: hypothetical protein COB38_05400 [Gammaproteobacteria bacterium]